MVVGAGSIGPGWGNGKATAATFAREGAQVFCVDRNGAEAYQMTLGGAAGEDAALGAIVGRAFAYDEVPDAVDKVVDVYLAERVNGERLAQTVQRIGLQPFRERLYGADQTGADRS